LGQRALLQRALPAAQNHRDACRTQDRMNVLLLFRRDLRTFDHSALEQAQALGYTCHALFVWDSKWQNTTPAGFARMGPLPRRFVQQALSELEQGLGSMGIVLKQLEGPVLATAIDYARSIGADAIWMHHAWGSEEQADERNISRVFPTRLFTDFSLFETLPKVVDPLPFSFTDFRKKIEAVGLPKPNPKSGPFRSLGALAFDPEADLRSAFPFKGGESHGWARWNHWKRNGLKHYKETRNEQIGTDYSSKLSPYLAWGCLSIRDLWADLKHFEAEFGANESTYWMGFEWLWREFFLWNWDQKNARFYGYRKTEVAETPPEAFERWRTGQTGQPWIDGHMRELLWTGYMSNRGRQNVASYLIHDLGVQWVWGALWFESALLDYEPCNNYGNWTYLAGLGNDPRSHRRFDPKGQQERYDPEHRHSRLWLSEGAEQER